MVFIFDELNKLKVKYGNNPIRLIPTLIDNTLIYLFQKKPKKGPSFITWSITYKCDNRCLYCNAWKRGLSDKKELTTKEALDIIDQAGKAKVGSISFTGGEPLLRKDLDILIKRCVRNNINVNINTNCSLLEKKAERITKNKVGSITVSVDSHKKEVHNAIRQSKRSFDAVLRGIEKVRALRKNKFPLIDIRAVITKRNYKELEEFIKFWENKVDAITFQLVGHEKAGKSIHEIQADDISIEKEDKKEFTNYFHKLQKKYKWLNNVYYNGFPTFLFNKEDLKKKYRCFAGYFFLKIDPYGNVYQCDHMLEKCGNLKEKSLMEIWGSKRLNELRERVKKGKNECFCWTSNIINLTFSKLLGKK